MNIDLKNIDFSDSYLLGWKRESDKLTLYVELLLTEEHELFRKYNYETEYGCYKLGKFVISSIKLLKGLPCEKKEVTWNEKLNEHRDVAEIESLTIYENSKLSIKTDEFEIIISGNNIELLFEERLNI